MHLPTIAILPFAKSPATPPLMLNHDAVALKNSQARLRGRTALVPDIDLGSWKFRAVIDWIEFRMHFSRGTQVQHVQDVLRRFLGRNGDITREDKGPGDVFSVCTIKVQEPKNLALITTTHQALVDTFGGATGARVTGIEISFDAYPCKPSNDARSTLLAVMQRTIWTTRDIW